MSFFFQRTHESKCVVLIFVVRITKSTWDMLKLVFYEWIHDKIDDDERFDRFEFFCIFAKKGPD